MLDASAFASLKPALTALALPPVPFLLLAIAGAALRPRRPRFGMALVIVSVLGVWLSHTNGMALLLRDHVLHVPAALSPAALDQLHDDATAPDPIRTAVVVLGGGREAYAPEYDDANLTVWSHERLRYGLWLSRQLGDVPVAFSGGLGWGMRDPMATESEVAQRIATEEYGQPLDWVEVRSRDTRENARETLALLSESGVQRLLLVTHGWHMPRAARDFVEEIARQEVDIALVPAPMGLARRSDSRTMDWLPTGEGAVRCRQTLREVLAKLVGA